MALVHAITVHHRGREMLEVCLRSLLSSVGVDLEIVVVLNGCAEGLPDIALESPRIHTVAAEDPVGFSAANNLGVDWAQKNLGDTDFYYFINNDTRSEPGALVKLVEAVESDPQCAVAGPLLMIDWAPDHINSLGLNVTADAWGWDEGIGIHRDEYGPLPPCRPVVAVTGSALLIDARIFHTVGGWTELYDYYFEDIDLCLKVREIGRGIVVEPAAVVGHQVSATMTLESDYKLFLLWRNRLVLAMVHWPLKQLVQILKIALVDEILRTDRTHNSLQRRAFAGAVRKLPSALRRRRWSWRRIDWIDSLEPRGSVPVITLPVRPEQPMHHDDPEPLHHDEAEPMNQDEAEPTERFRADDGVEEETEVMVPESTWDSARALNIENQARIKVLVVGAAPLPFENARMNFAPGARTWQFVRGLADDGHRVCLAAIRIPGGYDDGQTQVEEAEHGGILVYRLDPEAFHQPGLLDGLVAAYEPDVVVGAATSPSLRAAELAGDCSLWVDLFGDPMAEAQARAAQFQTGDQLTAYRDLLVTVLERGDAFSVVSERQRFAAIGQLGLVGRLNRQTVGRELVYTIPCCVLEPKDRPVVVGRREPAGIDEDDFIVLWSGGFNTWCDVDTLVDGLERAMKSNPRIRFVSTGGEIVGHDDATYVQFTDLVARSPFTNRFLIKGAVDGAEAAMWTARADLGVITERQIYERVLGSSGRVVSWLEAGLPFVCAATSELGSIVASEGLGFTYIPGDSTDLARAFLEASRDRGRLRKTATRASDVARTRWDRMSTTEPLRQWVREGGRLPDDRAENPLSIIGLIEKNADNEEIIDGLRGAVSESDRRYHEVREALGEIHQSRMWKVWMAYLAVTGVPRRLLRDHQVGPEEGRTHDDDDR